MAIDIEPLRKQLGRKIEDEDIVTQAPLKAMIATFDRPEKAPEPGQPIAPGWHLCFLHSHARPAQLGRDGAAFTGGVLPEIPMPRRMYAGSTFTFDGDIRVGDKLRREMDGMRAALTVALQDLIQKNSSRRPTHLIRILLH